MRGTIALFASVVALAFWLAFIYMLLRAAGFGG